MIEFDDKEMQKAFNECHFRQEVSGVDVCRLECLPCMKTIKNGHCSMLAEYFKKGGVE